MSQFHMRSREQDVERLQQVQGAVRTGPRCTSRARAPECANADAEIAQDLITDQRCGKLKRACGKFKEKCKPARSALPVHEDRKRKRQRRNCPRSLQRSTVLARREAGRRCATMLASIAAPRQTARSGAMPSFTGTPKCAATAERTDAT
jgi:hypothetical protein